MAWGEASGVGLQKEFDVVIAAVMRQSVQSSLPHWQTLD